MKEKKKKKIKNDEKQSIDKIIGLGNKKRKEKK